MASRRNAHIVVDALGVVPFFVTAPLYQRWHQRWGDERGSRWRAMPGDELVPNPSFSATRGHHHHPYPKVPGVSVTAAPVLALIAVIAASP